MKIVFLVIGLYLCIVFATLYTRKLPLGYEIGSTNEVLDVFSELLVTRLTAGSYTSDTVKNLRCLPN